MFPLERSPESTRGICLSAPFEWGGGRAERASSTPHIAPQKLKINKFLQTLLEISQKLSKVKGG